MVLSPSYTFPPLLILPWGKFSSYFHYFLGTALLTVSFYPGDHSEPHFALHCSLDTALLISYHRMTFLYFLLFYHITKNFTLNNPLLLPLSGPPISRASYKPGASLGITPKLLICRSQSTLSKSEMGSRMVVVGLGRNRNGELLFKWVYSFCFTRRKEL